MFFDKEGMISMLNNKQKKIVHRRWLIISIIIAVIITLLGLWTFTAAIAFMVLVIYIFYWGFLWLVDWLSGEDLRNPHYHGPDNSDSKSDSVSDTLWDIELLHSLQHHDHFHDDD